MAKYDCGSGWNEWIVPSRPFWCWWINIRPACKTHDIAYEKGGLESDRLEADLDFHNDIINIYKSSWLWQFKSFRYRADLTADTYFNAVRKWGEEHFNYEVTV